MRLMCRLVIWTGRAHCQCQVAFVKFSSVIWILLINSQFTVSTVFWKLCTLSYFDTRWDTLCLCLLSGLFCFARQWSLLAFQTTIFMELTFDLMFTKYQAYLRCFANQNKPHNWQRHRVPTQCWYNFCQFKLK